MSLNEQILQILREVNEKLDAVVARLMALENRMVGVEEPEPEDVEAYMEAEREIREGKIKPLTRHQKLAY